MAAEFSLSMRALSAESGRRVIAGLLLAGILLGAWGAWFFLARVTVYEVSQAARLEADRAVHSIEAPVAGRVVQVRLELDRQVHAGDVLVELDAESQRLQFEEERTRLAASTSQLAALRKEIKAEQEARDKERQEMGVALLEARAHSRKAESAARLNREEAQRSQRLFKRGFLPEVIFQRAQAEAQQSQAEAEGLRLGVDRAEWNQRLRDSDRQARIERLKREVTQLEGAIGTAAATIKRLEYEIERRSVRAPVAGQVGEVAPLLMGAIVQEKDKLGVVVSPGEFKIIADFPPPAAVGRIQPGQHARLRLEGFPWLQYGSIPARVEKVASEAREGKIRVELISYLDHASLIPIQHGLPGTVEIEVDRLSPATLVLRAVGQLFSTPGIPSESPDNRQTEG